jgi:UDP-N-acetylglucosamine 2-epimerase (non-hydrolysing)
MKVASIVGARPQFIKLAPLSRELRKLHREVLIDTGQHYDQEMAGNFFSEFKIPKPDHALGIGSGEHGEQTGRMLIAVEKALVTEKPDLVVVFGDTNSTLAGALAATKMNLPVAHVEAGLRSYDRTMPEEINRVLTDHISVLLFCPDDTSKDNLKREGITEGVHVVGDVMLDALDESRTAAEKHSKILTQLGLKKGEYQLLTIHRPSNTDVKRNLQNIISAVGASGVRTVFPAHPRTSKLMKDFGMNEGFPKNITVTKPLGHMDTVWLEANAKRVLTDSGGIQKEAYILGVPCITLRDTTEWVETINAEWNVLVGADPERISRAIAHFEPSGYRKKIFGPPGASMRIAKVIDSYLTRAQ